jgi:excinuclease ABC subunit A
MTDWIRIRGARVHNLKNIDLDLPRNRLIVITGLSGSGKSSLAFDTLYAEGQRRYVESLSAYARQFLDRLEKPDVDLIEGLSPAISIEQRTSTRTPRSTVGTVTEIYDYLRVLFARIGKPYCPNCGDPIQAMGVDSMVDRVVSLPEGTRVTITSPVVRGRKGEYQHLFQRFLREGFSRVIVDGEVYLLEKEISLDRNKAHTIDLVVDRVVIREGIRSRVAESIETALRYSDGLVKVLLMDEKKEILFNTKSACPKCEISLPTFEPRHFSFNAPQGACPECNGLGVERIFDPDKIIMDPDLPLTVENLLPFRGREKGYVDQLLRSAMEKLGISPEIPYRKLSPQERKMLMFGGGGERMKVEVEFASRSGRMKFHLTRTFPGIIPLLEERYRLTESPVVREELEEFMSEKTCPACDGLRLKPEVLAVKVGGLHIGEVSRMTIRELLPWLRSLSLTPREQKIADRIFKELLSRLQFLVDVGLDYLTLDRSASTLSGGEEQRIHLATQLGNALSGVLYILDEPSVGLHPRDHGKLLDTLFKLRDRGNTVIVVEHDEETIRRADWVVDLGPGAGLYGGEVVVSGPPQEVMKVEQSLTAQYLVGKRRIPIPEKRRSPKGWIVLKGVRTHNLKGVDVRFPKGCFCVVTGVSGSGKSSLVMDTLYPALANRVYGLGLSEGKFEKISGWEDIEKVIPVDQTPIGRTPRSNPATYVDLFGMIRKLFASTPTAREKGYTPSRFSFNIRGGRCELCQGAGVVKVEMHFLPDLFVTCDACGGKRYNRETLEVFYKGKNIYEVLEMSVEEAYEFFKAVPSLKEKLELLKEVGLSYIKLGQPATTLSGGEAQRIKLARELSRKVKKGTVYILDEPTTGLHLEDVRKLLEVLQKLVSQGGTVIVIEHHRDVILSADYVIDLGPEGGDLGGEIVAEGTPEEIARNPLSYTGKYLWKGREELYPEKKVVSTGSFSS